MPSQSIRSTGCRFARRDPCRTWNTGNFGPDAICFNVDRPGIAIAGAIVYSGTGSYEYQLELLYDTLESPAQHKWETLESITGTYDQDIVNNEMAELKFERPVHIKVNKLDLFAIKSSIFIVPKYKNVFSIRKTLDMQSDYAHKVPAHALEIMDFHRYGDHAEQCFHFINAI